jgi:APA family basic amino acid/polyamine antiporter
VAFAALAAVGPRKLASSSEPLATAVRGGSLDWLAPAVRIGATVATLGVLLSLLAGVSRTTFAMAGNRDLPTWLDAVHERRRVPYRAELAVGLLVIVLVLVVDLRDAIGFSAFAVLVYYAITNAAALTLPAATRRGLRALAAIGLLGCVALAFSLPRESVLGGCVLFLVGIAAWAVRSRLIAR